MLRIQSWFRYGREDKESRSNADLLPTFWLRILGQDRDPSSHPAFVYLWNGKTNNTWVVCHVLSTQEIQNWWVIFTSRLYISQHHTPVTKYLKESTWKEDEFCLRSLDSTALGLWQLSTSWKEHWAEEPSSPHSIQESVRKAEKAGIPIFLSRTPHPQ